jgi:hypothetical protein
VRKNKFFQSCFLYFSTVFCRLVEIFPTLIEGMFKMVAALRGLQKPSSAIGKLPLSLILNPKLLEGLPSEVAAPPSSQQRQPIEPQRNLCFLTSD